MIGPWLDHALFAGGMTQGVNRVIAAMHPKQLAFFNDPRKAKALLAGRQSGKTFGVAMWLIAHWQKFPGQASVYITSAATHAMRRVWPTLQQVARRFGLKTKLNHTALTMTFSNGYQIWVTGCKDKNEADKVRGEARGFVRIAIDEPATFENGLLEYLCTEAADATLMQTDGDILLAGTPGPIPKGFWHALSSGQNKAWSVHTFTALDNPHLQGAAYLKNFKDKYGLTDQSPKVLREFYGRWALDTEALVYLPDLDAFTDCNGYWELPLTRPPDFTTIGVDLGYSPDPCAFVVASSWFTRPDIWIRRAYTMMELTPDLIAGEVRKLRLQYAAHKVLIDSGGGGKTTAMALQKSYGVAVEATPKGEKRPKIDLMRGALNRTSGDYGRTVKVHLVDAQELVSEYKTILWNDARDNHHELSSDHCADAAIQACLPHKQFSLEFEEKKDEFEGMDEDKLRAFEEARSGGRGDLRGGRGW